MPALWHLRRMGRGAGANGSAVSAAPTRVRITLRRLLELDQVRALMTYTRQLDVLATAAGVIFSNTAVRAWRRIRSAICSNSCRGRADGRCSAAVSPQSDERVERTVAAASAGARAASMRACTRAQPARRRSAAAETRLAGYPPHALGRVIVRIGRGHSSETSVDSSPLSASVEPVVVFVIIIVVLLLKFIGGRLCRGRASNDENARARTSGGATLKETKHRAVLARAAVVVVVVVVVRRLSRCTNFSAGSSSISPNDPRYTTPPQRTKPQPAMRFVFPRLQRCRARAATARNPRKSASSPGVQHELGRRGFSAATLPPRAGPIGGAARQHGERLGRPLGAQEVLEKCVRARRARRRERTAKRSTSRRGRPGPITPSNKELARRRRPRPAALSALLRRRRSAVRRLASCPSRAASMAPHALLVELALDDRVASTCRP